MEVGLPASFAATLAHRSATIPAKEERQDDGGQQAATEAGVAVRPACSGEDDARARACGRVWRGAAQPG